MQISKICRIFAHMLEDYIFNSQLQYRNHVLVYTPSTDLPIRIEGVLGSALLSALLTDTPDGEKRQLAIETAGQRREWIKRYEQEVRRDDWGLFEREVNMLNDAYIQFASTDDGLQAVCPQLRLLDLALEMVSDYMRYLTVEKVQAHIWQYVPWHTTFAEWLMEAAYAETDRQLLLHINWTDAAIVNALAEGKFVPEQKPTLSFEGEPASSIIANYYKWMWRTWSARQRELPGAKPASISNKNLIISQESDWSNLQDRIEAFSEADRQVWDNWMNEWLIYLSRQLKPQKQIQFWHADVDEDTQTKLIAYLRVQERQPHHYKSVTAAVYALRQLGYIRRSLTTKTMRTWLTDHLTEDYITKNNAYQFTRAWNEHGRYAPAILEEIDYLKQYGIYTLYQQKHGNTTASAQAQNIYNSQTE